MVFKRGKSVPGGASGVGWGIDTWRLAAAIGDSGLNPNPKRRRDGPDGPDYKKFSSTDSLRTSAALGKTQVGVKAFSAPLQI